MTDANDLYEIIMRELDNVVISDTGDTKEEQESFTVHEETVSDDFPPSLLSYFETSKSRAAVCEKFILEELEDFTASHHTKDMMNLPYELDEELNKQVTCETENKENNSSAETHLLPTPTETKALSAHSVSLCLNSEDQTETDEYMECKKYLEVRALKSSMNEEEIKKSTEYQREHIERQHCEEMTKEEQRRQRERDFQEELRKIMEAEKLRQKELELMEKRAQEKLEQEFLLQQELISNLQKRVEKERKMREEEQRRIKEEGERKRKVEEEKKKREEEDRRKREEEMIKREMERKKLVEEIRRNREDEEKKKIEEMRLKEKIRRKKEEEQRKEEEEKRKMEKEENRKREEEKNKIEDMRRKEEQRKIKEIRLEEEKRRRQVEEEERKRKENDEEVKEREKNRKREEEETRKKEEEKKMIELERKKMGGDKSRINEEEIGVKEEGRHSNDKDKRREEEVRITMELEVMKQEEMRHKGEERKSEEETRKAEVEKKRKEEGNSKIEEIKLEEDEKIKKHEERRHSIEGKDMLRMEEEEKTKVMGRQKEEEKYNDVEKEKRLRKEKELDIAHEAEDKEKRQEEVKKHQEKNDMRKREDGRRNTDADKREIKEDVRKNQEENIKSGERRLREEGENNKIKVLDTEKEERLIIVNKLQGRRRENNGMKIQNESKSTENTRNSLTSQLEDRATRTSSSPGPLHSESTVSPTSSDLNKDTSQTSTHKTRERQDEAVKPSTSSGSLPMCLPEHTEQKRLSWMKDCVPWSKLSLQNRRKQKGCVRSRRGPRRAAEASGLPPLCPHTLLQSTGCRSLEKVTTVTLEDLPGCGLSTLAQCNHLQSLTLRRCGLKSLEGIKQLPQLCYIDLQENDISFVDCENMSSLRVLRLGHNELTSIHGLSGAENLDLLDLSHNSITRIAGLESMKRLQRLSVDHNQLISTKGLRDVYTLLHLDCSHNHLASVEGLENSALLQTLDLRANSLTEPPTLNNHILLRELHLDDNSISSLQGLAVCWLPLMHHLSVAQNRITHLPSMSDFVSLANLDLRFNCMSELQNVCESLEGCQFLREVHLTGNPFQKESGWRSTLQRAVAGLRAIDGQETDAFMSAPAVPQVSSASGDFLTFCQAQLKQNRDLQQQHSRELSNASPHLDAVKSSCRHFAETLKLAVDQRFAHEYGDTTVSAGQTTPEKTLDVDSTSAEKLSEHSDTEPTGKVPAVTPSKNNIKNWCDTLDTVTTVLKAGLHSSHLEMAHVSNHQDLDPRNTAAVVIQQWWREYRQKCGNISSPPAAEKGVGRGGGGGEPESGPSYINDCAATIIQAFWRGFALRRRLASALAAVTCPDSGEDETFEEVDVDEFVLDEAALERHWTLPLCEDSPSRRHSVSEEPLSLKPLEAFPEPSQHTLPPPPPLSWRPKQAWVAGEQVDSTGQRISPEGSNRNKSAASSSVLSGLSARSEKILEEWGFTDSHTAHLMLRRAQKMKSKKQQQKKFRDPSVRLALFRNCSYQRGPVEARNRPEPHNRNYMKASEAALGLRQADKTEQVTQGQADRSDRDSESERFLPEISSDVLNGGRVQLVADPGYTERLHHASGLWANSNLAAQPCKERNYPRRNSLGHARGERPSPNRVTSAPLKKERISFRDNPVQLSGGWGGGKKRDKVYK
uniref:Leucine-rich repeats and IQ motif containing 1 n=2 Tax=Seriola dumerili TaxID=41447 RepID=A0A3B4TJS0_SERDU